jgi:hypothetical protein
MLYEEHSNLEEKYTWKRFIDNIKCDIRKMQFVITFRKKKFTLLIGKKTIELHKLSLWKLLFFQI